MPDRAVRVLTPQEKRWPSCGPFSLDDAPAYTAWRDAKLAAHPTCPEDFWVEVKDLCAPTLAEQGEIRRLALAANMALYATRSKPRAEWETRRSLIFFGKAFGLAAIEDHRSAEADGIVRIEVVDHGDRLGYIPYTDKPISWHTDGYYNFHGPERAVRAMLLHCVRPADTGGANRLLDPEIAYVRLRDSDPGFIEALMHPEAMTIPANIEAGGRVRRENVGPVFHFCSRGRTLGMRFTARKRNIVWRDDPTTRLAVAKLEAVLHDDPLILETHFDTGQGLICNNVLHDRSGFAPSRDAVHARLLYRVRYGDRIGAGVASPDNL